MKIRHILATICIVVLCSCGNKSSFTISGTLTEGAGKTIYIEEMTPKDGRLFIDSVKLDSKGSFKFSYEMPYNTFYTVNCSEVDYIVLLPQGGEKIEISGQYGKLARTYEVKGSPESHLLWQIQDYNNDVMGPIQEIVIADRYNHDNLDSLEYKKAKKVTDSLFADVWNMQRVRFSKFITDNAGSLATLIALYTPFNGKLFVVRPVEDFEVYEQVADGLENDPENGQNPHTQHFRTTVESMRYQYMKAQSQGASITIE